MKWSNYTSALGDNMSPFAPKKACDPATAIGIGVGAASLIGGLANSYMNLKNQADTNATNYKIWQEQLAAQKENWQREQSNYLQNRKWQLEDTANQRQYDSPQAQKARYLAAGINPYLANSIGQGQAVQSPPQSPSFSSPASPTPMQSSPVDLGIGLAGQNAANAYFMASKNETDMAATKQHINNETLDTISKVNQRNFQNGELNATMNKILQDIRFNNENWSERSRGIQLANDSIEVDLTLKKAQADYQKLINAFTPKEQAKILKKLDKELDEIASRIRSNDADSAYKSALKALSEAQEDGVNMDNATKQEIAGSLVAQEAAKADKEDFEAQMAGRKYYKGEFFGTKTTGADAHNNPINFRGNRSYRHRVLRKDGSGKYIFGYQP